MRVATATASLPPQSFATGSAVVNMLRQVGLAIGVAVLIAVLGDSRNPTRPLPAFRHGWEAIVIAALAAGNRDVDFAVADNTWTRNRGAIQPNGRTGA